MYIASLFYKLFDSWIMSFRLPAYCPGSIIVDSVINSYGPQK